MGLTVGELKQILEDNDDELPVMFSYNYGDYNNTIVAEEVKDVSVNSARMSSYFNMHVVLEPDEVDNFESDTVHEVLILSS